VREIVRAAAAAGLDFVILTDHDTNQAARDGLAGRHGGVLLVVGAEISPRARGHCLALGDVDVTGFRWMPDEYYLRKLRRDGADVYIAHPEGRIKPTFGINLKQWRVWESEHFDGIEIWSYMHDWIENLTPLNLPRLYLRPDLAIEGPDQRILHLWDRLNLRRRVAGIGALDAHAVTKFFGLFVAFKYEFLFRTILTHVLVDAWGLSPDEDAAELARALRAGRSFAAYDWLAPSEGFRFFTDRGVVGDRLALAGPVDLEVVLPRPAEIVLVHNGRKGPVAASSSARFPVGEGGVYRVEARLDGRPWIFSNPIFFA